MFFCLLCPSFAERSHSDEYYDQANNVLVLLKDGDVNSSVSSLKKMAAEFGEDDFIRTAYGINMLLGGEKAEAKKIFDFQLTLNANDRFANYCLGVLNLSDKNVITAMEYFSKAGENLPDFRTIKEYCAVVKDRDSDPNPTEENTLNSIVFDGYYELRWGRYSSAKKFFDLFCSVKKNEACCENRGFLFSYNFTDPIGFGGDRYGDTLGLYTSDRNKKETVSGIVTIKADMSKLYGAKAMLLYVDEMFKGMSDSDPELSFDSMEYENGYHDIRIDALDNENNIISSTYNTINIFNRQNAPIFFDDDVMWKYLWDFIQLKPSHAAVNYLLAVCDSKLKDINGNYNDLLRCVACDSQYRDAKKLLQKEYIVGKGVKGLERISTNEKKVCITFDDGPTSTTEEILNILDEYNAKATFFIVGKMAVKYPEIVRKMNARGHQVALHSQNHYNLTKLNYEELQEEVIQGICSVKSCGVEPTFYLRPPGGNLNQNIKKLADDYGINIIMWTKNTTHLQQSSPEEMVKYCRDSVKPGYIYLLHNDIPVTIQALPHILSAFRSLGYECVTLEEFFKKN